MHTTGEAPMHTTDEIRPTHTGHPRALEVSAEVVEATGAGLRIAEVGLVILLGLLVCPPLLILAAVVAVPLLAISAVVAAVVGAIAVPALLVRRVRAHHRAHRSTLFLHRLQP
jgi:Flp pilus assembly protein TadB